MRQFQTTIPLSLYIHLPWCVQKCPYCDFNSHVAPPFLPEAAYIDALIADLDEQLPKIWGRRLSSIFFGGGTPSLFSAQSLERLLQTIHSRIPYGPDLEITLEANPGTLDEARFHGYRQAGINRLSIGVQSLQDPHLKRLGRIHGREHALQAIQVAKAAGFTNFNVDLMHGLEGQTVAEAVDDLQTALSLQPTHLSWYQLTIEPNTWFHHQPPTLPPEAELEAIQEAGKAILAQHGMQHYEVSAYSLAERRSVHNVNYWEFGDYLGIGAGAHSKLTDVGTGHISRHVQVKNPRDYLDPKLGFTAETKIVSEEDSVFEFMLNALRLMDGVDVTLFTERTGLNLDMIAKPLKLGRERGLLRREQDIIGVTEVGARFLNDTVGLFLS